MWRSCSLLKQHTPQILLPPAGDARAKRTQSSASATATAAAAPPARSAPMGNVNEIPAHLRVGPACENCMGLGDLQTPFSWYSPVLSVEDCEVVEDKVCLLGTPWARLVNRLQVAFGFFCNGNRSRARALLTNCYLPLLPHLSHADSDCGIINEHRQAVRHVLDASWAAMDRVEMLQCTGGILSGSHRHNDDATFQACVASIPAYGDLSRKQKAAVCAIRGSLSSDPELLRQAVALNPAEGEWHHKLGCLLDEQRGALGMVGKVLPSSEELKALRTAYRLRPGPDSTTRLARSLMWTGPQGLAEANKLVKEAMDTFPDHPRVLFIVGCMAAHLRPNDQTAASKWTLKLFKRCNELVEGRCVHLLLKLSIVSRNAGDERAAKAYMDLAAAANRAVLNIAVQEQVRGMQQYKEDEARRRK